MEDDMVMKAYCTISSSFKPWYHHYLSRRKLSEENILLVGTLVNDKTGDAQYRREIKARMVSNTKKIDRDKIKLSKLRLMVRREIIAYVSRDCNLISYMLAFQVLTYVSTNHEDLGISYLRRAVKPYLAMDRKQKLLKSPYLDLLMGIDYIHRERVRFSTDLGDMDDK